MRPVTAYEDVDGNVHRDEASARKADACIRLRREVDALVEGGCWNGMTKADVADWIVENADGLRKALSGRKQ